MAQEDSALSAVLERLTAGDAVDVLREVLQAGLQTLIEAQATAEIGAARTSGLTRASTSATAAESGCWRPLLGTWCYASPRCGRGRSSRRC